MNINYQKEMEKLIKSFEGMGCAPSLMLHSCCAPCSSYVLEYLSEFFNITVLYYNPNIHPDAEYLRRLAEQQELIRKLSESRKIDFIEGNFDKSVFYDAARGLENEKEGGARCFKCYALRLFETARAAKECSADFFATTLTISPLKNAGKINLAGIEAEEKYGVKYLCSDFKKKEGYKRSIELSAKYGLYRQEYCGCVFSMRKT